MEPVKNEKGEWVIPASRRPDGTMRKERVVREGYVPQDEVRAFETRASKSKSKGIPGLPPPTTTTATSSSSSSGPKKTTNNNNKTATTTTTTTTTATATTSSQPRPAASTSTTTTTTTTTPPATTSSVNNVEEVNVEKRVKALRKKLREIAELEGKDVTSLSAEQREKVLRKTSLEEELAALTV
eukprot:gene10033-11097_t